MGKPQALRRVLGQRCLWREDPKPSVIFCGVLSAPCGRKAALHAAPGSAPAWGRGPAGPHLPHKAQGWHPMGWLTHASLQGGCPKIHSCLQGTGVRPAHKRGRLALLNGPQGYSWSKITHHRLPAVPWLCSPLVLSDSLIF